MAKKTNKKVKKLTKAVEKLQEQNEDLTEALEGQAQEIHAMREMLESQQEAADGPPDDEEPEATEAAERKADELGVDVSEVDGTGSEGRILVADVEEAADSED